jgi:hypothetical protein
LLCRTSRRTRPSISRSAFSLQHQCTCVRRSAV